MHRHFDPHSSSNSPDIFVSFIWSVRPNVAAGVFHQRPKVACRGWRGGRTPAPGVREPVVRTSAEATLRPEAHT